MNFQSFVVLSLTHSLVLEMINKTRLTYKCAHLRPNSKKTRPSALGMSDPIWGPSIHIFVDEKKVEKDKDLDQVNFEYTALIFLNF